jgi:hypothetical protein
MLPQAAGLVASSAERILAQQERVAELERSGRPAKEAKKLFKLMQETQRLQLGHVGTSQTRIGWSGLADARFMR